jgi:hypothetical protein
VYENPAEFLGQSTKFRLPGQPLDAALR